MGTLFDIGNQVSNNITINMTDIESISLKGSEDSILNGEKLQNEENVVGATDVFNESDMLESVDKSEDLTETEIDRESAAVLTDNIITPFDETKSANGSNRKRTPAERQLEINMTTKATYSVLDKTSSPEGSNPSNTSRYGRARKQKTIVDFYPTEFALALKRSMYSPVKSQNKQTKSPPTAKNLKSPMKQNQSPPVIKSQKTPVKQNKSPKLMNVASPDANILILTTPKKSLTLTDGNTRENGEMKLVYTPWNESSSKTHMKVYAKKDLIQRKSADKEETSDIMRSMFSIKSPTISEETDPIENGLVKKPHKVTSPPTKRAAPTDLLKKIRKIKPSPILKQKNQNNTSSTHKSAIKEMKTASSPSSVTNKAISSDKIVRFPDLDDAESKIDSVSSVMIKKDYIQNVSAKAEEEIVEIEKNCAWKLGDLAWARVGSHPFWPCLITRDPICSLFVRRKAIGRSVVQSDVIHVTFFADSGRRSWVTSNLLMKFTGLDDFNKIKTEISPDTKKKDPKFCNAFNVTASKKIKWLSAVSEAEMLLRRPAELREEFFILMFLNSEYCSQAMEKPKKQKIAKIKSDTDSNASLSDSLFDSLFACEKSPIKIKEEENIQKEVLTKPNNVDMSDIITACLDNIATQTGNQQIKVQSHMDRWLQKAKQPKDNKSKLSLSRNKKEFSGDFSKINDTVEVISNLNKSAEESKIPLKKRKLSPVTSPVKMHASNDITTDIIDDSIKEKIGYVETSGSSPFPEIYKKNLTEILETPMYGEKKSQDEKTVEVNNLTNESSLDEDKSVHAKKAKMDEKINVAGSAADESITITTTSTPINKRLRSQTHTITESPLMDNSISEDSSDDDTVDEKELTDFSRSSNNKNNSKYQDPQFKQFLDQNRDDYFDNLPHLSHDDFMSYMFKTWEYRKILQTDKMKKVDEVCLVKGMADDIEPTPPKKVKRKIRNLCDIPSSPVSVREKTQRKTSFKSYVNDNDSEDENSALNSSKSDSQPETKTSPAGKPQKKLEDKLNDSSVNRDDKSSLNIKIGKGIKKLDKSQADEMKMAESEIFEEEPVSDEYMEALKNPKPNLFKGLSKERVCEICENPTGLIKCKGPCGGMFHPLCVQKQSEPSSTEDVDNVGKRKKKRKKSGYIMAAKKKCNLNASKNDKKIDKSLSSLNDSQTTKQKLKIVKNDRLSSEIETVLSPSGGDGCNNMSDGHSSPDISDENTSVTSSIRIVANAIDFESQLSENMREMIDNMVVDDVSQDTSTNSFGAEGCDWNGVEAGECVIEDANPKRKQNPDDTTEKIQTLDSKLDPDSFKCNDCQQYDAPPCFICKSIASPKTDCKDRQRCSVTHCHKFFHMECLKSWPQTKYTTSGISKYVKKGQAECQETLSCPRHVCHTCVSDDPQGCKTRFSSDKLARCIRCPATYHCFTQCVPAGTKIITASQILCPKHCDLGPNKRAKIPYHVNTSWCFICAKGGSLICCETCPTSFHAECLNISPPEGGFICEECETGRLPLYGEIVWVKLGQYRWWPALVLHPSEVPPNINALAHTPGQFAVRFFGGYDHYWVSSGRVFPYQEGDTGHASSKRSTIDSAFMTAISQAQQAFSIIKSLRETCSHEGELKSSLLPPQYIKLKVNRVVGGLKLTAGEGATPRCGCNPQSERPCAPDSDCLNRMLLTECSAGVCAAGERCCNQAFEKRLYPHLAPSRTAHRGWGLKTLVDIKKGDFVIEYVGEVIDEAEFQRRMARRQEMRDENYYFLTLDKDRMIDAGPKGNVARFMNHSCEPNCETQKWTVNGDTRVGLFALEDIPAESEVTFNYNLTCAGDDKKTCLCGAKRCAGFIGAKLKQEEPQPKKSKKLLQKRKRKRKTMVKQSDSVTSSPSTSKKDPAVSKVRRKVTPITKEEPKEEPKVVDPNSIEADVILINKAIAEAAVSDDGEDTKKHPSDLLNGDSKLTDDKMLVSVVRMNGNQFDQMKTSKENLKRNDPEYKNGNLNLNETNSKAVKRKRGGQLQSDHASDSKSSHTDIAKRPRSNSVYFNKSVPCIAGDSPEMMDNVKVLIDTSPVDKHMLTQQNGCLSEDLIDSELEVKKTASEHITSSLNDKLVVKKVRGRPRKSV